MKKYEEYLKEAGNVHLAYYLEAADELGIESAMQENAISPY